MATGAILGYYNLGNEAVTNYATVTNPIMTYGSSDTAVFYWPSQNWYEPYQTTGSITCNVDWYYPTNTPADWRYVYDNQMYAWGSGSQVIHRVEFLPESDAAKVARLNREYIAKQKRWKAEDRAEELLLMNLPESQRRCYLDKGYFEIETGRCRYRINKGFAGNVELLGPDGKATHRLCIHPSLLVPNADNMLAQKLMIQTQEEEFLRLANKTVVY